MHRPRAAFKVAALALCATGGLVAALAAFAAGPAATTKRHPARKSTTVRVAASEFKFVLSKKTAPVGTVVFKVTNKGKIPHDFKIAGKKTSVLRPGRSATLRVVFKKKGAYPYLCTVPGHAAAGMKGLLGVGVNASSISQPKPPAPPAPTPPAPTPPPPTTTSGPGANTTITVEEYEFGFRLSQTTVPAGTITFVMKNAGQVQHNFDVESVPGAVGPYLDPGQSATMTVTISQPRTYTYVCDVPYHAQSGMEGQLVVTP